MTTREAFTAAQIRNRTGLTKRRPATTEFNINNYSMSIKMNLSQLPKKRSVMDLISKI